jgi:hypothetical protein
MIATDAQFPCCSRVALYRRFGTDLMMNEECQYFGKLRSYSDALEELLHNCADQTV